MTKAIASEGESDHANPHSWHGSPYNGLPQGSTASVCHPHAGIFSSTDGARSAVWLRPAVQVTLRDGRIVLAQEPGLVMRLDPFGNRAPTGQLRQLDRSDDELLG